MVWKSISKYGFGKSQVSELLGEGDWTYKLWKKARFARTFGWAKISI